MKLSPLFDHVILKPAEVEEATKSGIILSTATKEKPSYAEVVVKVGDTVIASKYAGTEVKIDEEAFTIVRQADILAIVTK